MTGHFPSGHGQLSDLECRHAPTCASKAPQAGVRGGRRKAGWDQASPLPEPSPVQPGMAGLPVGLAASLSSAPAKKRQRRNQPQPLAGAACRHSRRRNREKTRTGTPKGRPPTPGPSAKARCRSLALPMRPARNNLPKAALMKTRFSVPGALASALENRHQPTFSE